MPGLASLRGRHASRSDRRPIFRVPWGWGHEPYILAVRLSRANNPRGRQVSNARRPAAGKPMTRGKFITLEGIDGAGKSTHVEGIADFLRRRGKDIAVTREPGGTPLAEKLRELVLSQSMDGETETLLVSPHAASTSHRSSPGTLSGPRCNLGTALPTRPTPYQCAGRGIPAQKIAALERGVHDGCNRI